MTVVVVVPLLTVIEEGTVREGSVTFVEDSLKRTNPRSRPAISPPITPAVMSRYWACTLLFDISEHPPHDEEPQTGHGGEKTSSKLKGSLICTF
jgi:hypothetical protein